MTAAALPENRGKCRYKGLYPGEVTDLNFSHNIDPMDLLKTSNFNLFQLTLIV